jgi:hypothetical protein
VFENRAHELAVLVDGALGDVLRVKAGQPPFDLGCADGLDRPTAELRQHAAGAASTSTLARRDARGAEHVAVVLERRWLDPIDVL